MKKVLCLLLCAAMIFVLTACSSAQEVSALEARVAELEGQLETSGQDAAVEDTAVVTNKVYAINALVYPDGGDAAVASSELEFTEPTKVVVTPVLPEGKVVRLWSVNGQEYAAVPGEDLRAQVSDTTLIKAVLRDELKVTSINAYMQFLDRYGDPTGETFDEYVFEYDDENVSNQVITVYVKADIPSGYTVDYWKINEIPYYFNKTVTAFTVEELDETTVYEVVLKKASSSSSTPAPTAAPEPTATPNATPAPSKSPSLTFIIPSFPVVSFRPLTTPTPTPIIIR